MGQPVVHFEIGCRDKAATSTFYSEVFGWEITDSPTANMVNTKSDEGIQGHITALGHEPHQYVNFYIQVEDCVRFLKLIESKGGVTLIPRTEVPGGAGAFAWFRDPGGNTLGLWEPAPSG